VAVESAIGWIPTMLEQVDYMLRASLGPDEILPSEIFRRQVYCTYWFERAAPQCLLGTLPVDNVLFETDFPHPASLYRGEIDQAINAGLANIDEEARHKILWANAAALYHVDAPLSPVPH
jgi:hypothetical protein